MSHPTLIAEAEQIVATVQSRLPTELQALARSVPVVCYDWPTEEILGEEFEPDILGMFVGEPHDIAGGSGNSAPTHIMLFVENIYDEAEGEMSRFREEVRLTYLHELGHYFGWDEDELDRRGLA
jgi:predicted Zn-dependent protease with MMP-like domain